MNSERTATFVRFNDGENVSNERRRDDWLFAETTIVARALNAELCESFRLGPPAPCIKRVIELTTFAMSELTTITFL